MASEASPLVGKMSDFPQEKLPFESVIAPCKFTVQIILLLCNYDELIHVFMNNS